MGEAVSGDGDGIHRKSLSPSFNIATDLNLLYSIFMLFPKSLGKLLLFLLFLRTMQLGWLYWIVTTHRSLE